MHILPHVTPPRQRGNDENPSISGKLSDKKLPPGVTPKVGWKWSYCPEEMEEERPSVRRVWQLFHETCVATKKCALWKSDKTIAAEAGVCLKSAQDAIPRLVELGWIVKMSGRQAGDPGKPRKIWCRWAREADGKGSDPAGATPIGYGMSMSFDKPEPIRRGVMKGAGISPTATAKKHGIRAGDLSHLMPTSPQKNADKVREELIQENVNVNAALAGGEAEKCGPPAEASPVAELVDDQVEAGQLPPVAPPAPMPPSAAKVEAAIGTIRHFARMNWLSMIQEADVKAIRDAGLADQLPAAVLAINFAARPAETPPAAVPAPVQAPADDRESQPGETDLEALKTETLVNRLVKRDDPQRERIVEIVAKRMARDWDDTGSVRGFMSRLRMVGPKKTTDLSAKRFLSAFYSAGRFEGAEKKGAVFMTLLSADVERIKAGA